MRKLLALSFMGLWASFLPAQVENGDQLGKINVTGEAEMSLEADQMEIYIVSEATHSAPDAAQQAVMEEMSGILDYLKNQESVKEVKTEVVQLQPQIRDYQKQEKAYQARQVVSFTLGDVDSYGKVMPALLKRGIDGIERVTFMASRQKEYEQALLQQAIQNARQKAEIMAAELGQSVGKAIYVSDQQMSGGPQPMEAAYKLSAANPASVEAGNIQLRTSINVHFILK